MRRIKKWMGSFSGVVAVVMLLSLFAVRLPACAEEPDAETLPTYTASEGFSDTQGKNGWSYYGYNGNTGKYFTTGDYKYDTTQNAYISASGGATRGRIWAGEMLPGVNKTTKVGVVRAFTAEEKGTVTIDANGAIGAKDSTSADFFNVNIRIRKNGATIYPEDNEWEELTSRTQISRFQRMEGVAVKKGDVITFEAIRNADGVNETAMTKNIIVWDPVIRYTSVVPRQVIYQDDFTTLNTDFWRNKTNDWVVENGSLKNTGASSYIRFYAPNAVNYSMSFDLKFDSFDTETKNDQSGFFTMIRRGNGTQNFYRVRLDLRTSLTDKEIVSGVGSGTEAKFVTGTSRDKSGTTPWQINTLYHVTESIETDGDVHRLTFVVKDDADNIVASVEREFDGGNAFAAGGGGFSLIGNHKVAISSFVLEGEPSGLQLADRAAFFADDTFQTPVSAAADAAGKPLYAAIKTTSGFSNDFSSEQTPRTIMIAAYENDGNGALRLKTVNLNQAYVTSATEAVSVSLAAEETAPGLAYRAFVWDTAANMEPCAFVRELK